MKEAWEEEQMSNLGCESVSDLIVEVKRLRELLNMIADKALHEVETQPNGDESPYNVILNIAYEGVIKC